MLAALNLVAVGLGIGAGGLSATVVGLVVGIVVGLAVAGWVAGRLARHSERFHGAVTGLLLAGLMIVLARLGGSPAPTSSVLWLAVLAAVISGLTGWLAGRRKRSGP